MTTVPLPDGYIRDLLDRVPRAPGDSIPPGISMEVLDDFAARNALEIAPDLARWLSITNGPCVGPGGFFGVKTSHDFLDIEGIYQSYPQWLHKKWIPVAGDGCGNYYVILPCRGRWPVVFIDTSRDPLVVEYVVASKMLIFVKAILEKELGTKGWPFEQRTVKQVDPELSLFSGALPMPWDTQ